MTDKLIDLEGTNEGVVATGYAGFWRRFAAIFLDGIFMGIGISILLLILNFVGHLLTQGNRGLSSTLNSSASLISFIYFIGFESSKYQATPGKMILGIKVTDLEGKKPSAVKVMIRNLARILSSLTLGIGYLMAGFTGKKQALHDMVAGCLVVKK